MLASRFTLQARQAELLRGEDRYTVRELADATTGAAGGIRAAIASRFGWTSPRPARLVTR